jgi:hypothetical protein
MAGDGHGGKLGYWEFFHRERGREGERERRR